MKVVAGEVVELRSKAMNAEVKMAVRLKCIVRRVEICLPWRRYPV
jgi:hypothetical protein